MGFGAGPQGTPDWQKVASWDGPQLLAEQAKSIEGEYLLDSIAVSRWGYLGGLLGTAGKAAKVTLEWGLSEKGTKLPAESALKRQLILDPNITAPALVRLPNLAPWLRVRGNPQVGEGLWTPNFLLFGTNRVHPLELIPVSSPLIASEDVFAGVGLSTHYPSSYFGGPLLVNLSLSSTAVAVNVRMEAATAAGVWRLYDFLQVVGGQGIGTLRTVVPAGAWRISVESTGAVTAVLTATPALTGST